MTKRKLLRLLRPFPQDAEIGYHAFDANEMTWPCGDISTVVVPPPDSLVAKEHLCDVILRG